MKYLGFDFSPKNIIDNPSDGELRHVALAQDGMITQFGNLAVITRVRNRSAKFTEIKDSELSQDDHELLSQVFNHIKTREMIQLDRTMCMTEEFKVPCRIYVCSEFARLPLMWGNTLFPTEGKEPVMTTIVVPDWPERKVWVFPSHGLTIILGSDYKGEIKKSMLRMIMYIYKKKNMLGLHAGAKIIRVKKKDTLKDTGFLFFGLSGTGKTSLSCHSHWLKHPEGVTIRQDDVVILRPDGSCIGTEDSYYVKTDGLEPHSQPLLYAAAISPRAILENVFIKSETGEVDFFDQTLTSNGRCMVKRFDVAFTDDRIDLDRIDAIVFITRRYDIVPPIARLNAEWGAATFMLGESIETSAGDPTQAGRTLRVVGTNPFIIGSESEEGNIFLDIMKKNPGIKCYMLNTGWVGDQDKGVKISVFDSAKIIEIIARDEISWKQDKFWGYEIPTEIPGIDIGRFDLDNFYSREQQEDMNMKFKEDRRNWLLRFPELNKSIIKVMQ
jgi:phosphoenolpyruvate carboxykinase (ATP)